MTNCVQEVISVLEAHPLVAGYVASAMVQALPVPGTKEPLGLMAYRYFHDVTHLLVNAMPKKVQLPVPDPNVPGK